MSQNKVKFAIIGCGHIGKRHAEMIKRNPESELVALCDVLPSDKLNISQFEVPQYFNLVEMFAAHPEIEVVNIATPNGYHCTHALEALEARKHVVIEKPFIIQYSQRSIAVFGDTKSIKEELKKMGGVFNSSLKYNDQKRPGWIFMNYTRKDVQELLEKEEKVEEISDDEELYLEEVMKKSKLKDDEAEKINVFCQEATQSNFDKLQKSTKEDFIKFSNLIIRLEKGNINLAKKVIKLKV